MLLVGGGNRFRQIPDGRVEERVCPHCRVTRTFVECTKTFTVDVWFIDVYKSSERVLVCSECQEDIGMPPPLAQSAPQSAPRVGTKSTAHASERPKAPSPSQSIDEQLAAMKQRLAAEVPASSAVAATTTGTCVLYDAHALTGPPTELAHGTHCATEAERGNVFFVWVPKPPAQLELVLRVGIEVDAALRADAKTTTDRFLRVPSGRLRWAPLEAPERATELSVPAGNYVVDAWLKPQAVGLWARLKNEPRFSVAVRLRRTGQSRGPGGGLP